MLNPTQEVVTMRFILEELVLEAIRSLGEPVRKIRRHRTKLAAQIEDASESLGLNFYEANYATKGNRTKAFSIARQEAGETLGGLRIAYAKGFVSWDDIARSVELLKRIIAGLWRLLR